METNNFPKISVIVITYNRPEYLTETVQSILNQTFTDFELIIVDNCSDYDFHTLINNFNDRRIKAFQNQNEGVIAVNRNFGMLKSEGQYIALCDDDDLWFPDKLHKQLKVMEGRSEIGLCCTASSYINQTNTRSIFRRAVSFLNSMFIASNLIPAKYLLLIISYVTNSSVMLRKSVLSEVGLLDEDPALRAVEDYDLWLRISLKYRVYFLRNKLVNYRLHSQQVSGTDQNGPIIKRNKVLKKNFTQFDSIQRLILRFKNVDIT